MKSMKVSCFTCKKAKIAKDIEKNYCIHRTGDFAESEDKPCKKWLPSIAYIKDALEQK